MRDQVPPTKTMVRDRSAMSMLTFYINRGGKNLSAARRRTLERTKGSPRRIFHRAEGR
jgi:hypothetical protein